MTRLQGSITGAVLLLTASHAAAQSAVAPGAPARPVPALTATLPPEPPQTLGTRTGVAGAGLFGIAYLCSVLAAGVGLIADSEGNEGMARLFVPVAGPFMALAHPPDDAASGRAVVLVMDGVAQVGGIGMILAGIVMDSGTPVDPVITRVPTVLATPRSVSLAWKF